MKVSAQLNETTDTVELGVEVDGQFVPLVQTPGEQVRATAANLNEAADAAKASAAAGS